MAAPVACNASVSVNPEVLHLRGELVRTPRGPLATVLLALTGVLAAGALLRAVTRLVFGLRRPTEVFITEEGIRLEARTEVLGRTLRKDREHIPITALRSIRRELRYGALSLYFGAAALCVGTYWGVGLMLDGVLVPGGSPSLIGIGLSFVTLGIALDLALTLWVDKGVGRCQVTLRPLRGAAWTVGRVDLDAADALLDRVAKLKGFVAARSAEAVPREGTDPEVTPLDLETDKARDKPIASADGTATR